MAHADDGRLEAAALCIKRVHQPLGRARPLARRFNRCLEVASLASRAFT